MLLLCLIPSSKCWLKGRVFGGYELYFSEPQWDHVTTCRPLFELWCKHYTPCVNLGRATLNVFDLLCSDSVGTGHVNTVWNWIPCLFIEVMPKWNQNKNVSALSCTHIIQNNVWNIVRIILSIEISAFLYHSK